VLRVDEPLLTVVDAHYGAIAGGDSRPPSPSRCLRRRPGDPRLPSS
jgi:hypothetical protein